MSDEKSTAMIHVPGLPPPLPWERQTTETDDAWRAFKAFRDTVPPRRARSVIGFAHMTVSQWYNQYRWPERCDAYDRHLERVTLDERDRLLKQKASEVSAEHMGMLQSARHLAQYELDKLRTQSAESEVPLLRPGEVFKLSEMVVKLDRLIRGESTESVEHNIDYSKLTTDEIRVMIELTKKASKE